MSLTQQERFFFLAGLASPEVDQAARQELSDERSSLSLAVKELGEENDSRSVIRNLVLQATETKTATDGPRRQAPNVTLGRAASLVIAACLLTLGSYTAWAIITTPLLSDPLNRGWFNSKVWLPPTDKIEGSGVRAEEGFLRLVNRGYLRPRQEMPAAYELEFDWKWSQLGLNPEYAEHLTIVVRTNAEPSENRPYEATNGVLIKLNAWGGYINVADPDGNEFARTPSASTPFPAEKWHRIRIRDDGERISIDVTGPLIPESKDGQPLLECRHVSKQLGPRFAIYNRELVGFPHESMIRNLVVRELKKAAPVR
ncbi:MAG: hypothetical protein ACKOBW_10195 [Planctomycetota bacterium]